MEEMHEGLLGAHASGPLLAYKIMKAGYYSLTMENDCIKHVGGSRFVQKRHSSSGSPVRILSQTELSEAEWARSQYEQLNMIDERRMSTMCHRQL